MTHSSPSEPYSAKDRVIDELLVLHILGGEARAIDRLGARWQGRLLRVAYSLTGDSELAEVAAQEAWVGICRNWASLRDPTAFPAWAFGILRRKCLDAIRTKARRQAKTGAMEWGAEQAVPANGEDRVCLAQAFNALSGDHRIAARLFFLDAFTLAETAALTGVPLGTVKSRIFHARRQLKAHLSGETL